MKAWLERQGKQVSRKRVQRLMRVMGLRAIYRRPRTSQPAPEHRVYPYLLRNARVTRPNQVWAADITYLPMARGFLYLVAIMDWHSRYVVAWRLSNTLEAGFCAIHPPEPIHRARLSLPVAPSQGPISMGPTATRYPATEVTGHAVTSGFPLPFRVKH